MIKTVDRTDRRFMVTGLAIITLACCRARANIGGVYALAPLNKVENNALPRFEGFITLHFDG